MLNNLAKKRLVILKSDVEYSKVNGISRKQSLNNKIKRVFRKIYNLVKDVPVIGKSCRALILISKLPSLYAHVTRLQEKSNRLEKKLNSVKRSLDARK